MYLSSLENKFSETLIIIIIINHNIRFNYAKNEEKMDFLI